MTARAPSRRYAAYALGVLLVAYILAFMDRQAVNLLVGPIKRDLGLSDVAVSLLQDLPFALFLSLGGLPIGRLIDTRRRVAILGLGIAFWSAMTAGFGLTRLYPAMFASRIGVGIGEATMTPSAYSLIGDYFTPRRLGLAIAIFSTGGYLGTGLAMILGGAIVGALPAGMLTVPLIGRVAEWQMVFLILAPIGLLVACWVASLREPPRRDDGGTVPERAAVLAYFRGHWRPIAGVNVAVGCTAMAAHGLLAWAPALLTRGHGLSLGTVGWRLGLIVIIACSVGTVAAGVIGDRLRARGVAFGRPLVLATASLCAIPFAVAAPLVESGGLSVALLGGLLCCLAAALGSGPGALQEITPNRMRGLQHAVAVLASNLIGLGLGPTVIAVVTDHVIGDERLLGLSLASALPVMLALAAGVAFATLRPYATATRTAAARQPLTIRSARRATAE